MIKGLILQYIAENGYIIIFIAFLLELLALPLPGETIMTYVGYLTYQGKLSWGLSIMAVSLGAMSGITISYFVGLKIGSPLIHKYGRYVRIDQNRFDIASNWYSTYGNKIIIVAYFVPGLRHISGYLSGILQLPFHLFALNAYLGALLYASIFVSLGKYLGPNWEKIYSLIKENIIVTIALLIILLLIYLYRKYLRQKNQNKIL